MCTADSIITVQPNPASTNHHHPGIMQKPGIPAQQMQRTGTREQASGSGTGQNPLAEHAQYAPQPRSIAWRGGGEAAMNGGAPCSLKRLLWRSPFVRAPAPKLKRGGAFWLRSPSPRCNDCQAAGRKARGLPRTYRRPWRSQASVPGARWRCVGFHGVSASTETAFRVPVRAELSMRSSGGTLRSRLSRS